VMPQTTESNSDRLGETLEELRAELARLGQRVAALEAAATVKSLAMQPVLAASQPANAATAQQDGLDEELVLVISAAIAAFLGKKPHIRQINLLRQDAWAQQGRVTIQASHRLAGSHH
jgi:methylmalonyl-CoA carboxyltransferase large subunit